MHCNGMCTKGVFLKGGIYINGVDSRQGGGGGKKRVIILIIIISNNNNKNEINENNNNKDMDGFHTFI